MADSVLHRSLDVEVFLFFITKSHVAEYNTFTSVNMYVDVDVTICYLLFAIYYLLKW